MSLNRGTTEQLEKGNIYFGYSDCIDAVFNALKDNMPDYLQFAGDDRAANLEAEIVTYLESCKIKISMKHLTRSR